MARVPLTLFNTQLANTLKLFVLRNGERFGTCVAGCSAANLHLPAHLFAFQDSAAAAPLHLAVDPAHDLDGVLRLMVQRCRDEAARLGCATRRIIGFRHLATPEGADIPGCRLLYLDGLAIAHVFTDRCCAILCSNSPNGFALRDLVTSVDEPVWCISLRDVFRQLADPLRYGIAPLDAAVLLQRFRALRICSEDGATHPPAVEEEGDAAGGAAGADGGAADAEPPEASLHCLTEGEASGGS